MAKNKTGLSYYTIETDRYQNRRIKRLKKIFGCQGIAVYDYLLCEIYRVNGCFLEWDENTAFDVAEYFGIKENAVEEIVKYCASVGLFNKELLCRGIVTSRSIQERYLIMTSKAKRINVHIPSICTLVESTDKSVDVSDAKPTITEQTTVVTPSVQPSPSVHHKDLYTELGKYAQCREDVWDAAAITGSFQNDYTNYYRDWLGKDADRKRSYPLNYLNQYLFSRCGEVNTEWYHAYGWCKDNLLQDQYTEIYRIVTTKPQALTELRKCIKEIKKGGIKQPGLFIVRKLDKL